MNNVNVTEVHNVYNTTVVNNNTNVTRASYNGGNGGVNARASSQEEAAMRERHVAATSAQNLQVQEARSNPQLKASENHGKPPIAATPKSGAFNDHAAVPAREGGRYIPPAENHEAAPNNSGARPAPAKAVHPKDIPPAERPVAPNTGNAKQDQKYQQQQEKIYKQQDQQRQKLQKQQDAEHQKLQKQQANEAKQQQTEQKHAQQTQKLEQKQTQQQQHMQSHQAPPKSHQAPPPQSHPAPSKPPEPHQN
jgi:hypothetical protein